MAKSDQSVTECEGENQKSGNNLDQEKQNKKNNKLGQHEQKNRSLNFIEDFEEKWSKDYKSRPFVEHDSEKSNNNNNDNTEISTKPEMIFNNLKRKFGLLPNGKY